MGEAGPGPAEGEPYSVPGAAESFTLVLLFDPLSNLPVSKLLLSPSYR